MGKSKKTEATINLEAIIQHIQSFLTSKQAARTTILSKSWYKAWLTRPNLDFDEHDFKKTDDDNYNDISIDELWNVVETTVRRYDELKLKIQSFRLCITSELYEKYDLATELIRKALKMGATNLSIVIYDFNFVLPPEVLGSESLVTLFVERGRIELGIDQKVRCSRLESLCLTRVEIDSDTISNMISSCPLIKTLSLSDIRKVRRKKHGKYVPDGPINLHWLHKLKSLVLIDVKVDAMLFVDFSSKFPSLKDLTLHYCNFQEEIQICSPSLERLDVAAGRKSTFHRHQERFRGKFDVPSICMFIFKGSSIIPSLSIKSTSRKWESNVTITRHCLSTSWFHKLNKLLRALRQSKIYLYVDIYSRTSFDYEMGDIQFSLKPEVENLTLAVDYLPSLSRLALFDGLFRICRPKFITRNLLTGGINNDLLYKTLVRGMNRKGLIPSDLMYSLQDLEEVNVQNIFEESVAAPLPLESLSDASTESEDEKKVCLKLKWRSI